MVSNDFYIFLYFFTLVYYFFHNTRAKPVQNDQNPILTNKLQKCLVFPILPKIIQLLKKMELKMKCKFNCLPNKYYDKFSQKKVPLWKDDFIIIHISPYIQVIRPS